MKDEPAVTKFQRIFDRSSLLVKSMFTSFWNWGYGVKHMQFGFKAITLTFAFALVTWSGSALSLSLEEALVQSLKNSNKIASSRDSWIAARESVFSSNATKESSLKYSGSGSLNETDSGSGYTSSDSYSNKITFSKNSV